VSFLGCASKSPTRTVTSDISAALENDINCVSVAIFGCSFKSTISVSRWRRYQKRILCEFIKVSINARNDIIEAITNCPNISGRRSMLLIGSFRPGRRTLPRANSGSQNIDLKDQSHHF
jgi:hypothetical protein